MILKQEEIQFNATLERGLKILDDEVTNLAGASIISGDVAFKLYDTYGFPLDLTQDILKQKNINVDLSGFDRRMQAQKELAKKSWLGSNESKTDNIWFDIKSEFGNTEFLGYSLNEIEANIIVLLQKNQKINEINNIGEEFLLISNQTVFYGESGGQIGDIGFIESSHCIIEVIDTIKYLGSIIAHKCILKSGSIKINDSAHLKININYRNNLRIHHSATHLLHAVLHEIIGKHVTQKGSLVCHDRLRFDISHPLALTTEELEIIENKVNILIRDNSKVTTEIMNIEEAIVCGSMALFGEKYDHEVRVISMGPVYTNHRNYSMELCGGTHVKYTGDIGLFKIVSETAIGAGIRRIEAVCGEFAINYAKNNEKLINSLCEILKSSKLELEPKILNLVNNNKLLEKQLFDITTKSFILSDEEINNAEIIGEAKFIYKLYDNIDIKILKESVVNITNIKNNLILAYINNNNCKLSIIIGVSKNITHKYIAGNIAKELSLFLDGSGGGGNAQIAQSGGIYSKKLDEITQFFKTIL
jgi:alanyl-tRNA synthetase